MRGENELAHHIVVSNRAIGVDRQVPHEPCHGWQSLGMDSILRFFDAEHAAGLGIFRQNGERKKAQGAVRYGACREALATRLRDRYAEQLTDVISYHIDIGHRHEFRESCGYTSDNVTVVAIQTLQPVERSREVRTVVRYGGGVSSETIRAPHRAWLERKQPPLLHFAASGQDSRCGYRACSAHDRSGRGKCRSSLSGAPRTTVLMNDDLRGAVLRPLGRNVTSLGESTIPDRRISKSGLGMRETEPLSGIPLSDQLKRLRTEFQVGSRTVRAGDPGSTADFYLVPQEGGGGLSRTSEVIIDLLVNQHLGRDLELILTHVIATKEKIVQSSGVSCAPKGAVREYRMR